MLNETGSTLNDSILIEKVCTALNVLKLLAILTAFSRELFSQKFSIVDVRLDSKYVSVTCTSLCNL